VKLIVAWPIENSSVIVLCSLAYVSDNRTDDAKRGEEMCLRLIGFSEVSDMKSFEDLSKMLTNALTN
jgi:hypothetical protein